MNLHGDADQFDIQRNNALFKLCVCVKIPPVYMHTPDDFGSERADDAQHSLDAFFAGGNDREWQWKCSNAKNDF